MEKELTLSTAALASSARLSCFRMRTISDSTASREAAASLATASRLAALLSRIDDVRAEMPALQRLSYRAPYIIIQKPEPSVVSLNTSFAMKGSLCLWDV